ncbi:hypothetical protein [Novosphingobium sp. SG707]|uniref:hypothetical protein n=1 Tax=Novosphingobium sp. SG707 TaxID=2586996 RepID=UPI0014464AC5|nr:hypothetical protein [Novosphingobium sp. SG707]NKJ00402.1 hypothetical protein [Novosphingobium sp. SG707]
MPERSSAGAASHGRPHWAWAGALCVCVWDHLAIQPSATAAILASYLGPYTLDLLFGRGADKYLSGRPAA